MAAPARRERQLALVFPPAVNTQARPKRLPLRSGFPSVLIRGLLNHVQCVVPRSFATIAAVAFGAALLPQLVRM